MNALRQVRTGRLLLAVGLIVVAFNLRVAIAALSPVLGAIERRWDLSSSVAGLLTTVPVICFGIFAFLTPRLIRRFGMERLLWRVLVVLTVGIVFRLTPSLVALFAGTAVVGGAIAVGNVLLPGLIKRDFPEHVGLMTGLYSMALFGGAAISAGLTVPIERATGMGWQETLASWAVLSVLAVVIWAPQLRPAAPSEAGESVAVRGLWRDRLAWAVTAFMGLQSLAYYATLAWLPTLFQDHHASAGQAGWLLSFSSFPGIAASLATPLVARRLSRKWLPVVIGAALYAVGYTGLLLDPVPFAYVWMTSLGLGQGAFISLALGYIVLRSPDTRHTAQLSTMAQGAGYLIASLGPLGLGAIHQWTGGWKVPLIALSGLLILQLLAGLVASQERHVHGSIP